MSESEQTNGELTDEKKRRRRPKPSFNTYVKKALKEVAPDKRISRLTVEAVNSMMTEIRDKIATEAYRLVLRNQRLTVTERDIKMAVQLVVPIELNKLIEDVGDQAIKDSTSTRQNKTKKKPK